jgi:hypothetical protein
VTGYSSWPKSWIAKLGGLVICPVSTVVPGLETFCLNLFLLASDSTSLSWSFLAIFPSGVYLNTIWPCNPAILAPMYCIYYRSSLNDGVDIGNEYHFEVIVVIFHFSIFFFMREII